MRTTPRSTPPAHPVCRSRRPFASVRWQLGWSPPVSVCPQVCSLWRDVLYASPRYWTGMVMVARCRELRAASPESRRRFYNSIHVRAMDTVALTGAATDDDILELVRHLSAPAARRVHSLSLRCCAVTDRGLESLLAHMQVSYAILAFPLFLMSILLKICF